MAAVKETDRSIGGKSELNRSATAGLIGSGNESKILICVHPVTPIVCDAIKLMFAVTPEMTPRNKKSNYTSRESVPIVM